MAARPTGRWRRRLVAGAAAAVWLAGSPPVAAGGVDPAGGDGPPELVMVARAELQGIAPFGDVATVGTTAVVVSSPAPGSPGGCDRSQLEAVDLRDPARPRVAGVVALPPGTTAVDLDGRRLATPGYTGDLVAVALAPGAGCPPAGVPGTAYYELTPERSLRPLGPTHPCPDCGGIRSVSLGVRPDGLALALVAGADGVQVDDLADPSGPAAAGHWHAAAAATPQGACRAGEPSVRGAVLFRNGQRALVALGDGYLGDLDLSNPATPVQARRFPPPAPLPAGGSISVAAVPFRERTLGIVAEAGPTAEECPPAGVAGVRVVDLDPRAEGRDLGRLAPPAGATAGPVVASGQLAFAVWGPGGLRVVDFSESAVRSRAAFAPAGADLVGVALLADHLAVTDAAAGLYVLERPVEGRKPSIWDEIPNVLAALGMGGLLAMIAVPRLLMARSGVGEVVPGGGPQPAGQARRRAATRRSRR